MWSMTLMKWVHDWDLSKDVFHFVDVFYDLSKLIDQNGFLGNDCETFESES